MKISKKAVFDIIKATIFDYELGGFRVPNIDQLANSLTGIAYTQSVH